MKLQGEGAEKTHPDSTMNLVLGNEFFLWEGFHALLLRMSNGESAVEEVARHLIHSPMDWHEREEVKVHEALTSPLFESGTGVFFSELDYRFFGHHRSQHYYGKKLKKNLLDLISTLRTVT